MRNKKKVFLVLGTRPDAIKMAPLIKRLRAHRDLDVTVISSGQHRELLDQVKSVFNFEIDFDLKVMEQNQTLSRLTSKILGGLDALTERASYPDLVLGHGDTTTCFATALFCFYNKIPFGHVEAGLRSFNLESPYPEEFNRLKIAQFARYHFAPSEKERENLIKEGVPANHIAVTGNTGLDALQDVLNLVDRQNSALSSDQRDFVMLTLHRREGRFQDILEKLLHLIRTYPEMDFVFPVHPNPIVRDLVRTYLDGEPNVKLREPMKYDEFMKHLMGARVVLTDSGGIQEEAAHLGKPVVLLRESTERGQDLLDRRVFLAGKGVSSLLTNFDKALNLPSNAGAVLERRPLNPAEKRPSEQIVDFISKKLLSA